LGSDRPFEDRRGVSRGRGSILLDQLHSAPLLVRSRTIVV
jgi:hypothetical protein